jgi:hypothetical protein
VSFAHTPELIDEAVARVTRSLDLVREDGLI